MHPLSGEVAAGDGTEADGDGGPQDGVGGQGLPLASLEVPSSLVRSSPRGRPATWSIRVMHSRCLALAVTGRLSPSSIHMVALSATPGSQFRSVPDMLPDRRLAMRHLRPRRRKLPCRLSDDLRLTGWPLAAAWGACAASGAEHPAAWIGIADGRCGISSPAQFECSQQHGGQDYGDEHGDSRRDEPCNRARMRPTSRFHESDYR
jgi:hypothetical protein